jgi:hypothetical protein
MLLLAPPVESRRKEGVWRTVAGSAIIEEGEAARRKRRVAGVWDKSR